MVLDGPDRALGALLGTFVGDALGMPYEGAAPDEVPEHVDMVEARLGLGTYTDDTEMMILLAESIVDHGSVRAEAAAAVFLAGCDPKRGYGRGTRAVLEQWRRGVAVAEAAPSLFGGQGSRGNGAAMRIAPVAVRFALDAAELARQAERSARITHTHPSAVDAAVVQATAVGAALRDEDLLAAARSVAATPGLRQRLDRVTDLVGSEPAEAAAELGNSAAAEQSVPTAILAALSAAGFTDAVTYAVRCGGDTDTIAAMAGAIAGAREGRSGIPYRWLNVLENGRRGRDHVERLALSLAADAGLR